MAMKALYIIFIMCGCILLRWPRRDIIKYILHFHVSAFSTFAFPCFRIFNFCISMFPNFQLLHFHVSAFSTFAFPCFRIFIFSHFHVSAFSYFRIFMFLYFHIFVFHVSVFSYFRIFMFSYFVLL